MPLMCASTHQPRRLLPHHDNSLTPAATTLYTYSTQVPFYMVPVMEIRDRVLKEERPRLPTYGCPPRLVSLTKDMWNHDPSRRPHFQEVVDVLIEVSDSMPRQAYTNELQSGADALDDLLGK